MKDNNSVAAKVKNHDASGSSVINISNIAEPGLRSVSNESTGSLGSNSSALNANESPLEAAPNLSVGNEGLNDASLLDLENLNHLLRLQMLQQFYGNAIGPGIASNQNGMNFNNFNNCGVGMLPNSYLNNFMNFQTPVQLSTVPHPVFSIHPQEEKLTINTGNHLNLSKDKSGETEGEPNINASSGNDDEPDDDDGDIGAPKANVSRLARNRTTARMRREKKKQEAETLSQQLDEARSILDSAKQNLEDLALSMTNHDPKERFQAFQKEHENDFVSGCLFCSTVFYFPVDPHSIKRLNRHEHGRLFSEMFPGARGFMISNLDMSADLKESILRHYEGEHAHDLKSAKSYLSDRITSLLMQPKQLLEHVDRLSDEHCALKTNGTPIKSRPASISNVNENDLEDDTNDQVSKSSVSLGLKKLTVDEKRKRRLERNAESARLCRQRKKLYIQKLRLTLPEMQLKTWLINSFVRNFNYIAQSGHVTFDVDDYAGESKIQEQGKPSFIGRLSFNLNMNSKRNLSYTNFEKFSHSHDDSEIKRRARDFNIPEQDESKQRRNTMKIAKSSMADIDRSFNDLTILNAAKEETETSEEKRNNLDDKDDEVYEAAFALSSLSR